MIRHPDLPVAGLAPYPGKVRDPVSPSLTWPPPTLIGRNPKLL